MTRITISLIFICLTKTGFAQYFQFSQYNFTPQRINPAQVGSSNYAAISFDFRNQATDGGFHLTSNILNVSYPLISRTGNRWAGIGLTFMDDRSGQAGIFNMQDIGLSYALNVTVAKNQAFSLGVKGLYQNRKFDLDGLYTGSQYIPGRGFSESLSTGENVGQVVSNFITFSAGLYWQQTDQKGTKLAYWGVSFFDFNKPGDSFLGLENQLSSTFVASVGFRSYSRGNVSVFPELLFTRGSATNVVNAGCITRYELKPGNQMATHVDIITKYVIGRSGIIGLQFHRENISIGFSYDFPIIVRNVSNTGAVEVGVELRKLVVPKKKNKRQPKKLLTASQRKKVEKMPSTNKTPPTPKSIDSTEVKNLKNNRKEDVDLRLNQKEDSFKTSAEAGKFQHEPLILEKATLHFNFEFNSVEVNKETSRYLDDLATALIENPEIKILLIGHTDNVGSEKFNLKLSIQRAQKLKNYLLGKGVADSRISVEGKGMKEPLNDNSSESERALNRRVELTILYKD